MNKYNLYDYLKHNLKVCSWTSDKNEIKIRCPYCGDSKNEYHAHLYIHSEEPHSWYCQKCQSSGGFITNDFIRDIGFYDPNLSKDIAEMSKTLKKQQKKIQKTFFNNIIIPDLENNNLEKMNMDYLNDRLGLDISINLFRNYKIILNFKKFFIVNKLYNEVDMGKYSKRMYKDFDRNCIGFLSYDKNYIVFRYLGDEKNHWRYKVWTINPRLESSNRFYTIGGNIDILKPKLTLNITEGIFDIIGVYHHINNNRCINNNIFIAANGKGFKRVIMYFIREGFLDLDVNIFSDKDVNKYFYKKMKNNIGYDIKYRLFYNEISKDFGVSRKNIKIKECIL